MDKSLIIHGRISTKAAPKRMINLDFRCWMVVQILNGYSKQKLKHLANKLFAIRVRKDSKVLQI